MECSRSVFGLGLRLIGPDSQLDYLLVGLGVAFDGTLAVVCAAAPALAVCVAFTCSHWAKIESDCSRIVNRNRWDLCIVFNWIRIRITWR